MFGRARRAAEGSPGNYAIGQPSELHPRTAQIIAHDQVSLEALVPASLPLRLQDFAEPARSFRP